jgi:hypothetical protein
MRDELETPNDFLENDGAAIGGNANGDTNINDDSCKGFLV